MAEKHITVRGAKHHNLKNIDVKIPRDKLVVITGVSGSGKSSLAFDTIYAEGQRRYVESLSAYARQFLGQMEKPKVDYIGGLSPAIAIEQKTVSKNPRSTVATVTEVMDYLRVLYANIGTPHCPNCGREVFAQSAEQIARQLADLPQGTRLQLLAPVVRNRKGTHADVIKDARSSGFVRARINAELVTLSDEISLEKKNKHNIDIIVDRLVIPDNAREDDGFVSRLTESIETTLKTANGLLIANYDEQDKLLSEHNACPHCDISFPELSTQMFSFNSPLGMCETCNGLGTHMDVDPDLIIHDENLSLNDGALRYYGELKKREGWTVSAVESIGRHYGFDLDTPYKDFAAEAKHALFYGSGGKKIHFTHRTAKGYTRNSKRELYGIIHNIKRQYMEASSDDMREWYTQYMRELPCDSCNGARLNPAARSVTVGETSLPQVSSLSIGEAHQWVTELEYKLSKYQIEVAEEVIKEIRERLGFMLNVGLHYLSLDRKAGTLSGGEGQRIRLASQIGSGLMGVLYILDEPSIGLHAKDNEALIQTLERLRDMGNTVLVVEHDEETMSRADYIIDLGPGAGIKGGELVAHGTPKQLAKDKNSVTGRFLSGKEVITAPSP
ncbi:MAG: excinuclease ABC subunit UvrA, partial [Trueperaceae bacterium]|nr:excinuclease ABC subunit UvrA [Trueperaceae bacterium]